MSSITRALIQKSPKTGEFIDPNTYAAWHGFQKLGVWTDSFIWDDLKAGTIELTRDTIVVGGILTVSTAVERLGFPKPLNVDYPDALRAYLGRDVRRSTLRNAHRLCVEDRIDPPVFIKPIDGHKEFDGHVISCFRDLVATAPYMLKTPEMPVWISETRTFLSEWRYFVNRGKVIGVGHYSGDPLKAPNGDVVRQATEEYEASGTGTVSYTLDFGVTDREETLLVESNDGFSVGCYGLNSISYAKFLEDRWCEMVDLPLSFR